MKATSLIALDRDEEHALSAFIRAIKVVQNPAIPPPRETRKERAARKAEIAAMEELAHTRERLASAESQWRTAQWFFVCFENAVFKSIDEYTRTRIARRYMAALRKHGVKGPRWPSGGKVVL